MKKLLNKEFIIGISVICAIIILIVGIDFLKGINVFSPSNYYYVYYKNVTGLEVSAPVTVDGFKVGQVRQIKFDYDNPGLVKVMLAVDKKLRLPEDSYAQLSSTLMEGGYIDIHMGDSKELIPVGGQLHPKNNPGLLDALSENLMPSVNVILPRIDSLLYNLNRLVGDASLLASIQRLDGITSNVENLTGDLKKYMSNDITPIMRDAREIFTNIDSVSYNLLALSGNLNELPLANTLDCVNAIAENLEKFSDQLNSKTSTLGLLTSDPSLYNRLNQVSADIDSLIVDIKKNPKRYISIKLL